MPLASCGFRPLHGRRSSNSRTTAHLSAIYVAPIRDRVGQQIRNHLLDEVNPHGASSTAYYRLEVSATEQKTGLAIEADESVTRINLTVSAEFVLRDKATGEAMLRGSARSIAAYNVIRSDYANLVAERDARARGAAQVAQEIGTRLAVFFDRRLPRSNG